MAVTWVLLSVLALVVAVGSAMYTLGFPGNIRTIISLALGGVSGIVFFNWLQGRDEE